MSSPAAPGRCGKTVAPSSEHVRDALETLGEHGAIHDMQYHGGRGADAAAASCHKAGWPMRGAAGHLADALAARAR